MRAITICQPYAELILRAGWYLHQLEKFTPEVREFLEIAFMELDPKAREQFREPEQIILGQAMEGCRLRGYPAVTGDRHGEYANGDMVCDRCGQQYALHPLDWRVIGWGDVPFLNVLCDGRRVKL